MRSKRLTVFVVDGYQETEVTKNIIKSIFIDPTSTTKITRYVVYLVPALIYAVCLFVLCYNFVK